MRESTSRKYASGFRLLSFAVPIRPQIAAARSPPAFDPQNKIFFLPKTTARNERSAALLTRSLCPQRHHSHLPTLRPDGRDLTLTAFPKFEEDQRT